MKNKMKEFVQNFSEVNYPLFCYTKDLKRNGVLLQTAENSASYKLDKLLITYVNTLFEITLD